MTFTKYQELVDNAGNAFASDYRYAEEMARQAVTLRERKQARSEKKADTRRS